jgi:hypothetical protein
MTEAIAAEVEAFAAEHPLPESVVDPNSVQSMQWAVDCMIANGVGASLSIAGSGLTVTAYVGEGDLTDRSGLISDVCGHYWQIVDRLPWAFTPDDEWYQARFDRYLRVYQCLNDANLPTQPPPTFDEFRSGSDWGPYLGVGLAPDAGESFNFGPGVDILNVPDELLESLPADAQLRLRAYRECPLYERSELDGTTTPID